MSLVTLLCGFFLLFFGKKYIWLFSGGVGFYLAYSTTPLVIPEIDSVILLSVSTLLAIVFIILLARTNFVQYFKSNSLGILLGCQNYYTAITTNNSFMHILKTLLT